MDPATQVSDWGRVTVAEAEAWLLLGDQRSGCSNLISGREVPTLLLPPRPGACTEAASTSHHREQRGPGASRQGAGAVCDASSPADPSPVSGGTCSCFAFLGAAFLGGLLAAGAKAAFFSWPQAARGNSLSSTFPTNTKDTQ